MVNRRIVTARMPAVAILIFVHVFIPLPSSFRAPPVKTGISLHCAAMGRRRKQNPLLKI
jgi:hypothetical protein